MDKIGESLPASFGVAGTALQAYGQRQQSKAYSQYGKRREAAAEFEAAQIEGESGQQIAASQREAAESRREAQIAASRALAIAAASGGASDPGVVNLIANLSGEGTYRSMVDLYQGENAARQLRNRAGATRYEGKIARADADAAARAQRFGAASTALKGTTSLYDKYGKRSDPKQIDTQWTSGYDIEGAL